MQAFLNGHLLIDLDWISNTSPFDCSAASSSPSPSSSAVSIADTRRFFSSPRVCSVFVNTSRIFIMLGVGDTALYALLFIFSTFLLSVVERKITYAGRYV